MLSVTLVAPLPAAIVCGEKVAVAPAGRPEAAKVIVGSVVPTVGLTARGKTAVSPGRIVCDGVLPPAVKLKGGTIGMDGAFTVTETAAEVLERKLAFPESWAVGLAVPEYAAVRLYVPAASDVVDSVATPEAFRAAVPSSVEPFRKLTVPDGTVVPLPPTVAVRASA
jgi:hypothetical protein